MKLRLFVAAAMALAAPAFAGQVVQYGPAPGTVPTATTGSFRFQGSNAPGLGGIADPVTMPSASESEPEPLNSAPAGAYLR